MPKAFCVYLMASEIRGTLYVGVTSDLVQRVGQHKSREIDGFTRRYNVDRLVWFELHESAEGAIRRERQIKEWQRAWKIRLIGEQNPDWSDIFPGIAG